MSDRECKQHAKRALALSEEKRYQEALEEYEAAYQRRPVPRHLLSIGRMQYKLGKPQEALRYYTQFSQENPHPDADEQASLDLFVAEAKAAVPPPPNNNHLQPPPSPAKNPIYRYREVRSPRPVWRYVVGGLGVAIGLTMVGLGTAALVVSGQCTDDLSLNPNDPPAGRCGSIYDSVSQGAPLVTAGAVALLGGIAFVAIPGPRRQEAVPLAIGNGLGLSLSTNF